MSLVSLGQVSGPRGLRPSQASLLFPWLALVKGNSLTLWCLKPEEDSGVGWAPLEITLPEIQGGDVVALSLHRVDEGESIYLLAVSEDSLFIWKNPQVLESKDGIESPPRPPHRVADGPFQSVAHVNLGPRGIFAAICAENEVVLINVARGTKARLLGHRAPIAHSAFASRDDPSSPLLVSVAIDATARLWDVNSLSCLRIWDSTFVANSTLTTCAIVAKSGFAAGLFVGDADGHLFRLSFDEEKRKSRRFDLKRSSQRWRRRLNEGDGHGERSDASVEPGFAVLAIHCMLSGSSRPLLVGVTSGILFFDPEVDECLFAVVFPAQVPSIIGSSSIALNISSALSVSPMKNDGVAALASVAMFSGHVTIIRAECDNAFWNEALESAPGDPCDSSSPRHHVSVVATEPLADDSVLKTPSLTPTASPLPKKSVRKPSSASKGPIEKPVMNQSQVKSSGYAVPPRNPLMFRPNTNFSVKKDVKAKAKPQPALKSRVTDVYPSNSARPSGVDRSFRLGESRASPVSCLAVSTCGARVACGVTDYDVTVVGESLKEKSASTHSGHLGVVNSAAWSFDGNWLLTASSDKTAMAWQPASSDPVMIVADIRNNFDADKVGATQHRPFPAELRHAQFFYLDAFFLVSSANSIYLYTFRLDATKNDVKRYKSLSRYKLVKKFPVDGVQSIQAASAVNSFYSHLVISACSNKRIDVMDLNVGASVASIDDAHDSKIHTIAQNQGSKHSALSSSEAYNLFLSSAVGVNEGVKLWDVRCSRFAVRKFDEHINRALPTCGAAFSPCGRFIASASEDAHAYLYEMGSGKVVEKYRSPDGASVTHVAFHPLHMKIFFTSLNGNLYLLK